MTNGTADTLLTLLRTQKTMVLATADPDPWTAPVYFVYERQRFYFFSSASSRHVTAASNFDHCAASIFRDGDDWRDIEGLQMDGRLAPVPIGLDGMRAFGSYLNKFPTVKNLFVDAVFDYGQFLARFSRNYTCSCRCMRST